MGLLFFFRGALARLDPESRQLAICLQVSSMVIEPFVALRSCNQSSLLHVHFELDIWLVSGFLSAITACWVRAMNLRYVHLILGDIASCAPLNF